MEEKFFVGFKMASDVQNGGRTAKKHDFEILKFFCILVFARDCIFVSNMNREHTYFVELVENGASIQNGVSK
jgi:hypothetical protein